MNKMESRVPNKKEKAPLPPKSWDEKLMVQLLDWRVELLGGLIFFFALLSLLNLMGLTDSNLLQFWTGLWYQLAGWGAYPIFISFMVSGLYMVGDRLYQLPPVKAIQIIGFELILLALLALTYQFTGTTLVDAYYGHGGGLIGWALVQFLYDFLGPFLTAFIYLSLTIFGGTLLWGASWDDVRRQLLLLSFSLKNLGQRVASGQPLSFDRGKREKEEVDWVREREVETAVYVGESESTPAVVARSSVLLPPLSLLIPDQKIKQGDIEQELQKKKEIIEQTLLDFGLEGSVTESRRGPSVTQFGVEPGYLERPGTNGRTRKQKIRVSQIAALQKDLTLALSASRLRIEAPVPGRSIVGIEVPNDSSDPVGLRGVLESDQFYQLQKPLAVALGRDVSGKAIVTDLTKMPHLLIAGTTGSGKSVCINTLVSCLVFNNAPHQLRLVMIDPKKVELIRFNGLPHLLGPVEVDHDRAIGVLNWLTRTMDERYKLFSAIGARNLESYNEKMVRQQKHVLKLPYIVVFIDELADLMAMRPTEVEAQLCRLAQMARATGIHLVVATQRPSTNVITGLIKANFPSRISFSVASNMDSRVILDSSGAEQLLGRGDMLFLSADASVPVRAQGCFVTDQEIDDLVAYWVKNLPEQKGQKAPWEGVIQEMGEPSEETDDLLEQAIQLIYKSRRVSTSMLQRKLRIGYPRAARLIQNLEEMGLVESGESSNVTRRPLKENIENYLESNE